ncbi:hypothetical protein P3H15_38775 [Rhodococcus sp. T2V]|uniref:hypothetical protein n=1 Tax=Rhodococcus sp. T2V TaxID=3034164 RepID=UPI0023E28928|nr:hypothetical protein [Rhodococcus sp. T2V]MDF3310949.1 hypothetical protein [Rhodococcus sp. T2V]
MGKGKARHNKEVPPSATPPVAKMPVGTPRAFEKLPTSAPADEDQQLRFRFGLVDERNWPLSKISREHFSRLLKRLAYFENLTVAQAKSNNLLADYDVSVCPNKSVPKILTLSHAGRDDLCRLTVAPSGDNRLFGFREGSEFHILWWDPNHDVWPEGKIKR